MTSASFVLVVKVPNYPLNLGNSAFLDFPKDRNEFSDAGYSALGRALTYATTFEAICRSLSSLHHIKARLPEIQKASPEGTDAFSIVIGEIWKQRLRQHIKKILEHQEWRFSSDITASLTKARQARNAIAHEAALGLPRVIETDVGHAEILAQIASWTEEIADGFMIVELTSLIETHEAIPTAEYFAGYPKRIVQWVTEVRTPGFGLARPRNDLYDASIPQRCLPNQPVPLKTEV